MTGDSTELEEFRYGTQIDDLAVLGSDFFKRRLFYRKSEPDTVDYESGWIPIGRRVKDGSVYYMDVREACRACGVGGTRAGKTFLLRAIGDRILRTNHYDLVYLTDVKNEFWSSRRPVQSKFHRLLLKGEVPSATKVVSLRPTFFKDYGMGKHDRNYWFSFDARKMSKDDFFSLVKADQMKHNQRIALDDIYDVMMKVLDNNPGLQPDYNMFSSIIDELSDLTENQRRALKYKFKPFSNTKFFETRYNRDVVEILSRGKGYVPCVNLEGFDRISSDDAFDFPIVTLNIVLKDLISARRRNPPLVKPLWIMLDELARFTKVGLSNSFKTNLLQSNDRDTAYGVNYFFVTQQLKDLPDDFLSQARYFFAPGNVDTDSIRRFLINSAIAKNQQIASNHAMSIKKMMAPHDHAWVVFDRNKLSFDVIKPLAPLSFHAETKN